MDPVDSNIIRPGDGGAEANEEQVPVVNPEPLPARDEEQEEDSGDDYGGGDDDDEHGLAFDDDDDEEEEEDDLMTLTPQQRAWALDIKAAIEADPEIDNLNDFCYVQMAIACKGNVQEALDKAIDMQGFRQEYDIRDNLEDAKKTVWEYTNLFDDSVIISFTYSNHEQCYIATLDLAAMDHKSLQTDKAWRNNLAGVYYVKQAMVPDFFAMNQGIVIIHECEGFDFFGKFGGLKYMARYANELLGAQPVIHREVKWFHTGMLALLEMCSDNFCVLFLK